MKGKDYRLNRISNSDRKKIDANVHNDLYEKGKETRSQIPEGVTSVRNAVTGEVKQIR
jgi:hypothetical protein